MSNMKVLGGVHTVPFHYSELSYWQLQLLELLSKGYSREGIVHMLRSDTSDLTLDTVNSDLHETYRQLGLLDESDAHSPFDLDVLAASLFFKWQHGIDVPREKAVKEQDVQVVVGDDGAVQWEHRYLTSARGSFRTLRDQLTWIPNSGRCVLAPPRIDIVDFDGGSDAREPSVFFDKPRRQAVGWRYVFDEHVCEQTPVRLTVRCQPMQFKARTQQETRQFWSKVSPRQRGRHQFLRHFSGREFCFATFHPSAQSSLNVLFPERFPVHSIRLKVYSEHWVPMPGLEERLQTHGSFQLNRCQISAYRGEPIREASISFEEPQRIIVAFDWLPLIDFP